LSKNLTIILPLKDRAELTEWWLRNNYKSGISYLILDGSLGDENEKFFLKCSKERITYKRCPPDRDLAQFVKKMQSATQWIKTDYVMCSDNDDLINFSNVKNLLNLFSENPDLICVDSGKLGFNFRIKFGVDFYSLPVPLPLSRHENISGLNGLNELASRYRALWYGIFTAGSYKKIWTKINESGIEDIYLIELMHTFMVPLVGSCYISGGSNYFRMLNSPSSSAASYRNLNNNRPHSCNIVFDQQYRSQVNVMVKILAETYNCNVHVVENAIEKYYCYRKFSGPYAVRLILALLRKVIFIPGFVFSFLIPLFGYCSRKRI